MATIVRLKNEGDQTLLISFVAGHGKPPVVNTLGPGKEQSFDFNGASTMTVAEAKQ